MNIQFYVEKLFASKKFEDFIKEYKDAFPCSAFFVIDKVGKENKSHFDYFVPEFGKMFSFDLKKDVSLIPVENFQKEGLTEIDMNHSFDFNDIEKMIVEKMEEEKVKNTIQKLLFSLQKLDGKDYLVGTVFISAMGMLKVHVDLEEMKIVLFEKKSFFDIVKVSGKDKKKD